MRPMLRSRCVRLRATSQANGIIAVFTSIGLGVAAAFFKAQDV